MPKAPDPSVAVFKRMNELQFMVANRTHDQGMATATLEETEQVFHEMWHSVRPRRDMGNPGTKENPHIAGAQVPAEGNNPPIMRR